MATHQLRLVAFLVVASTIDGKPIFSIADIIEPLPGNNYNIRKLLRSARLTAGHRGYVMVGRANLEWEDYDASARRINGLSFVPHQRNWRKAA